VIAIFECRSVFDTNANGTPAEIIKVAARCRRSWSRTRRNPAAADSPWNVYRTVSGRSGFPFSRANTRSPSS
jgi:hypothetical protein